MQLVHKNALSRLCKVLTIVRKTCHSCPTKTAKNIAFSTKAGLFRCIYSTYLTPRSYRKWSSGPERANLPGPTQFNSQFSRAYVLPSGCMTRRVTARPPIGTLRLLRAVAGLRAGQRSGSLPHRFYARLR
jgi:hypothetical protein